MIRRKSSIICIAGEKHINFLMPFKDGGFQALTNQPLEEFLRDGAGGDDLPKAVHQSVNQLLVVPDYWFGNDFHEFQARKKSVIAAFIERKLKLEQPSLNEAGEFYNYAIVQGKDRRQLLYSYYLQELVAYRLHRRLETLGLSPLRITTPALIWQAKLADAIDGFADGGVGFIHLGESECLLYFYFMGQFLFSRQIQLTDIGGDADQIYNRLNYEINQSFYLYSQKTKSSVESLFMLAPDPGAARQLSDLLGREVRELPPAPPQQGLADEAGDILSCQGFSAADLVRYNRHAITYKPLQKEMTWRPVQWAGFAVGLFLVALLAAEADYLYLQSGAVERQMFQVKSAAAEPPEMALGELTQILDEITRDMARPSGSGTVMRAFLAMPADVSVNKISLDLATSPRITIDAVIDADHPEAFKATLKEFLHRLNNRFDKLPRPLREQDVRIQLDRSQDERKALYRINFGFEIS